VRGKNRGRFYDIMDLTTNTCHEMLPFTQPSLLDAIIDHKENLAEDVKDFKVDV